MTGGTLRPLQHSLVNPLATVLLSRLHASVCFIGCNGVDAQRGITNINLPEAEINSAIDPLKDIEAVHPVNAGLLAQGRPRFVPSSAAA